MRIRDIIDIINANKEKEYWCQRLFERVPFIKPGEPDKEFKEWKKYNKATMDYAAWLETEVE